MVRKMNKTKFIEVLAKELNCDLDYSRKINDVLEENPLIGKKNKEKTVNALMIELKIEKEEAEKIYETACSIATTAIKEKIKHPFKDLNKE